MACSELDGIPELVEWGEGRRAPSCSHRCFFACNIRARGAGGRTDLEQRARRPRMGVLGFDRFDRLTAGTFRTFGGRVMGSFARGHVLIRTLVSCSALATLAASPKQHCRLGSLELTVTHDGTNPALSVLPLPQAPPTAGMRAAATATAARLRHRATRSGLQLQGRWSSGYPGFACETPGRRSCDRG